MKYLVVQSKCGTSTRGSAYNTGTLRNTAGNELLYAYWDAPAQLQVGKVYDITGTESEYNGKPQVKITTAVATNDNPDDFAPHSIHKEKPEEVMTAVMNIVRQIDNRLARELCTKVFDGLLTPLWLSAPSACNYHHAYIAGNLKHAYQTAEIAIAISQQLQWVSTDVCAAGGLLHDIAKLQVYQFKNAVAEYTELGQLFEHSVLGVEMINNLAEEFVKTNADAAILQNIAHIIASHHGTLEYGAAVTPKTIEAQIVSHADMLSCVYDKMYEESLKLNNTERWTPRIYNINNSPIQNVHWMFEVLNNADKEDKENG